MLMGVIWTGMILAAILFSCANGTTAEVGEAALEGAQAAVGIIGIYAVIIGAVIVGVLVALRQRMRELDSGAEEDAKKY